MSAPPVYLEECFTQQVQEKIYDIYVRIFVSPLLLSYKCWERKTVKHSMLGNPDKNDISCTSLNKNYYQQCF